MPPGFDIRSFLYLGGVGVIIGLVQIFKLWVSDTRWYPVIAIIIGLLLNWLIGTYLGVAWQESLIMGLIAGMAAGGVYSWSSTLKEGKQADKAKRIPPVGQVPRIG